MARYKPNDTSPRFIAVDLERQWLPGAFKSHREAGASHVDAIGNRRGKCPGNALMEGTSGEARKSRRW